MSMNSTHIQKEADIVVEFNLGKTTMSITDASQLLMVNNKKHSVQVKYFAITCGTEFGILIQSEFELDRHLCLNLNVGEMYADNINEDEVYTRIV
jgi:hypothetical protein